MKTRFSKNHLSLIERLSNALAVSGDESEIRAIIKKELKPLNLDFKTDNMGNLLISKEGNNPDAPKVMLSAHMDEVGFLIASDEGDGIFRFEIIGDIDLRQLPGKAVIVGKNHIPGVIGARPIHLTTAQERKNKIPLNSLRIDIGPGNNQVKPGDYAGFASHFQGVGPSLVGKALDNRLGVAALIEIIKDAPDNVNLQAAFTTQEETALRGARVAAFSIKPDLAFVIDTTLANDLPAFDDEENTSYNTHLGAGPAVYIADSYTLSDPRLVRLVKEVAKREKIPIQIRQAGGGGSEAGSIHRQISGIPTVTISTPARHIHTAASIARIKDFTNLIDLMKATLITISKETLNQERS